LAEAADLARLAWRPGAQALPEPIAARRPVLGQLGGLSVALPAGAFLQASAEAEAAIRTVVAEALGPALRIADLYAGCCTLGLPLAAAGRQVLALERDPAMVEALIGAARTAGCTQRLQAAVRDLERAPLAGAELAGLDGVVLDPPRAGAVAQAAALAAAGPPRIAMVSCNPATFARDAATLVAGGYDLAWMQPIDAFLWSRELELVGAFARAA
jgi:23S rRNA (uracil1939-C5)-methyltransferase